MMFGFNVGVREDENLYELDNSIIYDPKPIKLNIHKSCKDLGKMGRHFYQYCYSEKLVLNGKIG
jgi:hypothetical protein